MNYFVRLILLAAMIQGIDFLATSKLEPKSLEENRNKILKINWKPISIFPEEAERFQKR